MAKVIREFKGAPDGERKVRTFRPGDEVTGDLARVAIGEGWATDASTGQTRRTAAHMEAPKKRRRRKAADE